jgi:hypothetical protein
MDRVRVIPYGANGTPHWSDLETFGSLMAAEKSGEDIVEFVIPMPKQRH